MTPEEKLLNSAKMGAIHAQEVATTDALSIYKELREAWSQWPKPMERTELLLWILATYGLGTLTMTKLAQEEQELENKYGSL